MQVEELLFRLKSERSAITRDWSEAELKEFESFLAALEQQRQVPLARLTKRLGGAPKKRVAGSPTNSAKVDAALAALRELEDEIRTWENADYGQIRERVTQICEPLTKGELGQLSLTILGKRNSSLSKAKMITALTYSPVRLLELRLMNVKA